LTPGQVADYRRDGYVVAGSILGEAEVERLRQECDRVWASVPVAAGNPRVQWRGHLDGTQVADRLDPVADLSPVLESLTLDPRLLALAGTLLGDVPILFKDKVIMKRPGTLGYGMHQDYPYWEYLGVAAGDYVTLFLPLDAFDAVSGSIEMFPGLHDRRIPPPPEDSLDSDERCMDLSRGRVLALAPGDVVLMHSLTPHRSAPNRSPRNRRVLIFTYTRACHTGLRARYAQGQRPR
jgi:ectoine hydroxylase-related dioxygenase (phytanoyl-CoA dioxygenase family)